MLRKTLGDELTLRHAWLLPGVTLAYVSRGAHSAAYA
jgi:hypothetical protein